MIYKTLGSVLVLAATSLSLLSLNWRSEIAFSEHSEETLLLADMQSMTVEDALSRLDGPRYAHHLDKADPEKVQWGKELIFEGRAKRNGKRGKLVSIHFVCTDCHNLVKETEHPADKDPAHRLKYAVSKQIQFLPGSTLWGIYDRNHWYNDDYVKKYGDLITNARDSLANAVQVCSKYCSSGRFLEDWELDAIMHYFKDQQLHLSDLPLSKDQLMALAKSDQLGKTEKTALRKSIESSFERAFPATFLETMPRDQRKYGEGGDAQKGEQLYELSCLYCHENGRVTYLNLSKDQLSARMFWKNITTYNDLSLYQIIRHGTYAKTGRKQYMPHFTKEKMSDQQIEDLVAYIKKLAKK
ncbi:MAG: cytochrome c [Bacteroidetes bacterium]|nr:MAG: cytochrome c [Bacteroidota bacterium]